MANLTKPQGLSCKKPFFVNYAKMLCKHNYVNRINEESGGSREPAQSAICGRGRKNPRCSLPPTARRRSGRPSRQGCGETKNFVILTMLFFMSPPSVGCGAARPPPALRAPACRFPPFPARQTLPAPHRRRWPLSAAGRVRQNLSRRRWLPATPPRTGTPPPPGSGAAAERCCCGWRCAAIITAAT